jgi:hypothetical protein
MGSFLTMRFSSLILVSLVALSSAVPAVASSHKRHATTVARSSSKSTHKLIGRHEAAAKHAPKPKILGQRTIDDGRATEIQTALIKAGYLSGEPSGHWDSESEAAMQKLQGDNGWQTKLVPDSRALIKLGLGPGPASASSSSLATPPGPPSQPGTLADNHQ